MKSLSKIIKWSILALVIEIAGFFYVDRFYLAGITSFNIKKVELKNVEVKKKVDVEIPVEAKSISISFDGKFVAYILDDGINVVNRESGKKVSVKIPQDTKATFFSWLPDRDRMYIAEKGSNFVKFSSYDALKDDNIQWATSNSKDVKIALTNSKYEVKDLTFSVNTNVQYVSIGNSGKSIIYRFNAMHENTKEKEFSFKLGKIGVMQLEDRLIYEDISKKQMYIEGFNNIFKDKILSNPCFLGADFDDIAYLGSRTGDKVTKIYYGPLKTPISSWKSINLPTGVTRENISISIDGDIYENMLLNGQIINLKTNKSSDYTGKFVAIYKNGIVSMDGNTLKENKLN
ncbi:MAG: hypothetical protein H7Y18_15610 [Clostridiaceae bacterium]|nr:hypothetical protein [Clostridiaceae bacterium]